MTTVLANDTTPTATATEAARLVADVVRDVSASGVTFAVAADCVHAVHGYWKVPLVPSAWLERMSPVYEEMAIAEERLREQGVSDVILTLRENV